MLIKVNPMVPDNLASDWQIQSFNPGDLEL